MASLITNPDRPAECHQWVQPSRRWQSIFCLAGLAGDSRTEDSQWSLPLWHHSNSRRRSAFAQTTVPHREQDAITTDREKARQVHGISPAQRITPGEIARLRGNRIREFDRSGGRPKVLPGRDGATQPVVFSRPARPAAARAARTSGYANLLETAASQPSHSSAASSLPDSSTTSLTKALLSK